MKRKTIEKELFEILELQEGTTSWRLRKLVERLLQCSGCFVIDKDRLRFISDLDLEDYLPSFSRSVIRVSAASPSSAPSFLLEAIYKKERDLRAIQYILNVINQHIHGDDLLIFYENYFLRHSYRKIHEYYGFSKNKCTSAQGRILYQAETYLFTYPSALGKAGEKRIRSLNQAG